MSAELELRKRKAKAKLKMQAAAQSAPAPAPTEAPQEEQGFGMNMLEGVGRGLDTIGGAARFAGAGIANIPYALSTGKSLTQVGDLQRVIQGQGPSTAEYMERGGVPEGGKMSDIMPSLYSQSGQGLPLQQGGWADPSARGAAGFVGDVAMDPLTYLTAGTSAGARALNPIQQGMESAGKKYYSSSMKNVDKVLAQSGDKGLGKLLLKEGAPVGNMKQTQEFTSNVLSPKYNAQRQELYNMVDSAGVKVDPSYAKDGAEEVLNRMRTDPGLRDKAGKLQEFVDKYKSEGPVSVQQMSDWKTNLGEALPDAAFTVNDMGGKKLSNWGHKVQRALQKGFKNELEAAGEHVQKGLGKKLTKINSEWGTVLNARKPLAMEIKKAETKNAVTQIDALLGGAMLAEPMTAGAALAAKKGQQAVTSTRGRQGIGRAMMSTPRMTDPVARRAGINAWQNVTGDR